MQRSSFLDACARLTIIRQLLQTSRRLIYSTYLPVCSLLPSVSQRAASLLPCEAVAPFLVYALWPFLMAVPFTAD